MLDIRKPAFNLKLLKVDRGQVRGLKEVTSLDIFESPGSTNFNESGLFSTEIFGPIGSDERDFTFGYISTKTSILHPLVWTLLKRVRGLYHNILTGKEFAVWNPKTKDFDPSDQVDGDTGYHFFMTHWDELVIPEGKSDIRRERVKVINEYREKAVNDYILVMPAGLRDAEIDSLGRTREGEINEHYRKLLSIGNTIAGTSDKDISVFNKARVVQQLAFNEIYKTIERLLSGKKGVLAAKWASRNIVNGTRNVISAMDTTISDLDDLNAPTANDTIAGLWQVSRGALPIFIERLKNGILANIFGSIEGGVPLVNRKTLKSELVQISPKAYDRWTTYEGLEKVISSLSNVNRRAMPVLVDGNYLALVYKPKDRDVFRVFNDISDLPPELNKEDVYPITYFELIYLCNYKDVNKLCGLPTRYPVEGEGSIYPSNIYLKTTVISERRYELGHDWQPLGDEYLAAVYPDMNNPSYIDTTVVHPSRLAGMGGDYDGDMVCLNILYTSEGISEIRSVLTKREAYVNPAGGFRASMETDTTTFIMMNMTGE